MRIGAVNYLNSKPLVEGLEQLAPEVRLLFDLPSRLADSLAAGRLDVALVPAVEFFRTSGYSVVSDACVACRGPVLSVKLHFRVPPRAVRRVALDEGSRTSAALTQILLTEMYGARPEWEALPIGCDVEATDADAVLLIGDRAISDFGFRISDSNSGNPQSAFRNPQSESMIGRNFIEIWDLGDIWSRWTGLPFVFAMWVARPDVDVAQASTILAAARDRGVMRLAAIGAAEADDLGIDRELAKRYLCENLHFKLERAERKGLARFYQLCVAHGLAPGGLDTILEGLSADGCSRHTS